MAKKITYGRGLYLYRLFHELCNMGCSKEDILKLMQDSNLRYCDPPKSTAYVRTKYRGALKSRIQFSETFNLPFSKDIPEEKRKELLKC